MTEPVPAYPIAQVTHDDLGALAEAGRRIRENLLHEETYLAVVLRTEAQRDPERLPGQGTAVHRPPPDGGVAEVTAFLRAETDAVWLDEPEDVGALRRGELRTGAGVEGQYFSPLVMVSGLVRSLAIIELPALIEELAAHPDAAAVVRRQARRFFATPLGVLGYFGLPRLGAALRASDAALSEGPPPQELRELLVALGELVARYQLWLHQMFPWGLGRRFLTSSSDHGEDQP